MFTLVLVFHLIDLAAKGTQGEKIQRIGKMIVKTIRKKTNNKQIKSQQVFVCVCVYFAKILK